MLGCGKPKFLHKYTWFKLELKMGLIPYKYCSQENKFWKCKTYNSTGPLSSQQGKNI